MYELASCTSTPANHRDAEDRSLSTLALELKDDASLRHHQAVVVNSTTAQTSVQGRRGMDLSVSGHHDHFSLPSSTSSSSSSSAASSLPRQHPAGGNRDNTTLQEPIQYVNGLRATEQFRGAYIYCSTSLLLFG